MSKQYAVIGLGKFGFAVATTLAQAGKEVLAVDKDPSWYRRSPISSHMRRARTSPTAVFLHRLASATWMS